MNKAIAVIVLTLASSPVMAGDMCKMMESLGQKIMEARQGGVPMSASIEIAEGSELLGAALRPMVIEAYKAPRFTTPSIQQRTTVEFGNMVYAACLKSEPV